MNLTNEVNVLAVEDGQLVDDLHALDIVAYCLLLREQIQVTFIQNL